MRGKAQLRKEISIRRKELDSVRAETLSESIVQRLTSLPQFEKSRRIGLYLALPGEVQLQQLFSTCWKMNKNTCVPLFNKESGLYEMSSMKPDTPLKSAHYGVLEPMHPIPVPLSQIDLMIVPGVGFDLTGNRLGRGGGYYDRLLLNFKGATIGVAFDFQVLPTIPVDKHDISVDFLITETKSVKVQNER